MSGTDSFVYQAQPARIVFGANRFDALPDEVARIGMERVLVLATPDQYEMAYRVASLLGPNFAGTYTEARMHVPTETAAAACAVAEGIGADGCVAVGGGSTIGLGKAIALQAGLPYVAVPTTYSGSEMTPIWGLTESNRKRTGRDLSVLPRSVIYDPTLTLSLPADISGVSGINAVAHALEALYAPDTSPVIELFAEEGIRCLARALPRICSNPSDLEARTLALRGSWLSGSCLGSTTMSLHHKLCHVLGGLLDLPHAPTHAVILPYVAAFNLADQPIARSAAQRALGASDPALGLIELAAQVDAPSSLAELGVAESSLVTVVDQVVAEPYANPRPVRRTDVEAILQAALLGSPPSEVL